MLLALHEVHRADVDDAQPDVHAGVDRQIVVLLPAQRTSGQRAAGGARKQSLTAFCSGWSFFFLLRASCSGEALCLFSVVSVSVAERRGRCGIERLISNVSTALDPEEISVSAIKVT